MPPRTGPRRSHKKSRAGCQRCKARKVKCDEAHPKCGNCTKHGVACDFDDPSAFEPPPPNSKRATSDIVSPPTTSSPNTSTSTPLNLNTPSSTSSQSKYVPSPRLLELRLLHHYTVYTSGTISAVHTPATHDAWQVQVLDLGLESACLMDAILAVSALHLRIQFPHDKDIVHASHSYMASCVSTYNENLQAGVTAANAEALFATAALIAFQAAAARRFPNAPDDEFSIPMQWFHSMQGLKTVTMSCWLYLRDSERVSGIINSQPPLELDLHPKPTSFFGPLLEGLANQLAFLDPAYAPDTAQAYEHAVAHLNWAHQTPSRSRTLCFPTTVSRRFVELLERADARAIVITACFFAMIKPIEDVWWLEGAAKREVSGLVELLPQEWKAKAEWAVRIVSHEGPMVDEVWGARWYGPARDGVNREVEDHPEKFRKHIDFLTKMETE